jgi:hypothetical protein
MKPISFARHHRVALAIYYFPTEPGVEKQPRAGDEKGNFVVFSKFVF